MKLKIRQKQHKESVNCPECNWETMITYNKLCPNCFLEAVVNEGWEITKKEG